MSTKLTELARDFDSVLKARIQRHFEYDSFDIHFDHNTVKRLDDAVNCIGLSVYGMGYTESEINITLQFSEELTGQCGNNLFHYCQLSIANSGDFFVVLDSDALDDDWNVRLTTSYDQHLFSKATDVELNAAIEKLRFAFQTKLISIPS